MVKWEEERKVKQNASARQTDELINKISNLRETLGLINEEGDSLINKNMKENILGSSLHEDNETDFKGSINRILENSQFHSPHKKLMMEGQIPIVEHEAIVREEILKVEQYYKSMLPQLQKEYETRINQMQDEYEEKLNNIKDNLIGRDQDLHKYIEEVTLL